MGSLDRGKEKTRQVRLGFGNTTAIFINQKVKFKEGCDWRGIKGLRMRPEQEHSPSGLILDP